MKVKCAVWELFHENCWYLQSEAYWREPDEASGVKRYHISHHVVISHSIIPVIKFAQLFQTVWIHFFPVFSPLVPQLWYFSHPLCSRSPLSSFLHTALIKHGVGGGAESSSWAEEKGSNSTSQDGAVTHNGPTILLVPPWIPSWKALSSGSFLIGLRPADEQTHARINTHVPVLHTHTHTSCSCVYVHVCHLYCISLCFGPFEVLLRPMTAFLVSTACWGR